MRYFAQMTDGRIDKLKYFTHSDDEYVYYEVDGHKGRAGKKWYCDLLEIKNLLELNELEEPELNYFQSTEFNAGMIYSQMDKAIGGLLKASDVHGIEKEIKLPKIQVLPKYTDSVKETKILDATITSALEHFATVYGDKFTAELRYYNDPIHKQYIVFECKVNRRDKRTEMTIAEIEEALGYKIKVVGDK